MEAEYPAYVIEEVCESLFLGEEGLSQEDQRAYMFPYLLLVPHLGVQFLVFVVHIVARIYCDNNAEK